MGLVPTESGMSKGTQGGPPVVVWFGQDLRLHDHAMLQAVLADGRAVPPVHVLDDAPGVWTPGGATRWRLHGSLAGAGVDFGRSHTYPDADLPQARQRAPAVYRATVRWAA